MDERVPQSENAHGLILMSILTSRGENAAGNAKDVTGCTDWQPGDVYLPSLIEYPFKQNSNHNSLISIDLADGTSMAAGQFRLITRGDFDGVVCGALLRDHGLIDEIVFFVAPILIGGEAPTAFAGRGIAGLAMARRFRFESIDHHGADLEIRAVRPEDGDVHGAD